MLLVLGVNAVAAVVPFTPGGAGVQQALLVKVFAGTASGRDGRRLLGRPADRHRACSRCRVGFAALVFVFGFRSFRAVIEAGKESRAAEASA